MKAQLILFKEKGSFFSPSGVIVVTLSELTVYISYCYRLAANDDDAVRKAGAVCRTQIRETQIGLKGVAQLSSLGW